MELPASWSPKREILMAYVEACIPFRPVEKGCRTFACICSLTSTMTLPQGKEGAAMSIGNTVPAIKPNGSRPKRGNGKLLRLVFVFFIILFIILFFQSSMSKISEIVVEGNELVSQDDIIQTAGVLSGDNFFTLRTGQVKQRLAKHPFIESVEVQKSFPGVLKVKIKEYRRVAFQLAADGTKEVLLADGSALPVAGQAANVPMDMPILSGWLPDNPLKAKLCLALSQVPAQYLSDISEIRPDPSTAYEDKIKMYTRAQYEIYTTIEYLPERMQYLGFFINELEERGKTSGVITMLEQNRHSSFESVKPSPTPTPKETPAKSNSKETQKNGA